MGDISFVLGPARSGKSRFGERLAAEHGGRVLYLATLEPLDDEVRARIAVHRARRPHSWTTVEEPLALVERLASQPAFDVCLLDCLTLWMTNLLLRPQVEDPDRASADALSAIDTLLEWQKGAASDLIVVSNEVGAGIVPAYPLGRQFRDLQGLANQRVAREASKFYYLFAGHFIEVKSMGGQPI